MKHPNHCRSRVRMACVAGASMLSAVGALAAVPEVIDIDPAQVTTVATGIRGPEGPSVLRDGSVAMVEFTAGVIPLIHPDGRREDLASLGAGVAGTAVGRDGAVYVVKLNTGRFMAGRPPGNAPGRASAPPPAAPPPGAGSDGPAGPPRLPATPAAIVRIDPLTHAVRTLYTRYNGEELKAPDDLAVDGHGDLWFTDLTEQAVYWARADGSALKPLITAVPGVNGITLSPDRRTLYIVSGGKLLAYTITGRGALEQRGGHVASRVVATLEAGLHEPDGMKTEANGDILLACWEDGILRYTPAGRLVSQTRVSGLQIINIAFGGADGRTLYLAAHPLNNMVGALQSIRWPRPGVKLP